MIPDKPKTETRRTASGPLTFLSTAATHVGKLRRVNEDCGLDRAEAGLWAVADGMGGHRRGDLASGAIVEALTTVPAADTPAALLADVRERLGEVDRALRSRGEEEGGIIASTVVCLLLHDWNFACLWAGDSRLYLMRDGRLHRISHDHSLVQEMVDEGRITESDSAAHPQANVVTRAVGGQEPLQLEVRQGRAQPGDLFLLTSDGLTKLVSDEAIALRLGEATSLASLVDRLLGDALDGGGSDNMTIVAVRCIATPDHDDGDATVVLKRSSLPRS